jgi:hypothetical protein
MNRVALINDLLAWVGISDSKLQFRFENDEVVDVIANSPIAVSDLFVSGARASL